MATYMSQAMAQFGSRLLVFAVLAAFSSTLWADEIVVDFLMNREPEEKLQAGEWYLHADILPLWKQALTHPESELKRQAAEAIARAYEQGHHEVASAGPELLTVLTDQKVHPAARHAAAHALIVINNRTVATALFEASQSGGKDLRLLVEPALAKWKFDAIRPIWRQRLTSPTTQRRELLLAVSGLAEVQDTESVPLLLALTLPAEKPADIRLAAARAASQIVDQGLAPQAQQLLARHPASIVDRLCAARLVSRDRSDATVAILQKLGTDAEPTVAGESLRSLFAFDPKLVLPVVEFALQSPDSNIRRIGINTCLAEPAIERLSLLAKHLNDPHPDLRVAARNGLHSLTKEASLNAEVRKQAIEILSGDDWRGQEQAAVLLGALDEEGVMPRLLELLEANRPEVTIAAAWSLKTLEVAESSAPVLALAQRLTDDSDKVTKAMDDRLTHLFELLGRLKMIESESLLRRYVPKSKLGPNSRSAAIWALGLIHEGKNDEALAAQLMERALDTFTTPPEEFPVRRASLLTLGRLQAKTQLPALKNITGDVIDNDAIELAARWAILRISGEALPIRKLDSQKEVGWFLEPVLDPKK